jgi:hypothetical protein
MNNFASGWRGFEPLAGGTLQGLDRFADDRRRSGLVGTPGLQFIDIQG